MCVNARETNGVSIGRSRMKTYRLYTMKTFSFDSFGVFSHLSCKGGSREEKPCTSDHHPLTGSGALSLNRTWHCKNRKRSITQIYIYDEKQRWQEGMEN